MSPRRARYRAPPKDAVPAGVIPLSKDAEKDKGREANADAIREHPWAVIGITPGGTYGMVKQK
ncbi:hypothetical protein [Limnoglobus roseus]|uniref:hypothetical protein n=1 Tax=Limnoglobus roseus TaxID=2598579 RepID=UPI0011EB15EF|nr:hypothetical protein [Limnoglobus roseus]